jgi:hypothetical protein
VAVICDELPYVAFTQVRNAWLRDRRISWKAKGLLAYFRSHTGGYRLSHAQMVREATDGKDSVTTALRELEAAGYLTRVLNRSGGRFAEDDYRLTDPFDLSGQLIPGRETRPSHAEDGRKIRQGGKSASADSPDRQTRPVEEQGENTPVPTGQGARHLTPVQTAQQQIIAVAQELTREHYDASGGLAKYPAVLSIVKRALSATDDSGAARWNADAVRGALTALRDSGRPVTLETLRAALTTPQGVRRGGYGAPQPYRNPDPRTQPDAFSGGF